MSYELINSARNWDLERKKHFKKICTHLTVVMCMWCDWIQLLLNVCEYMCVCAAQSLAFVAALKCVPVPLADLLPQEFPQASLVPELICFSLLFRASFIMFFHTPKHFCQEEKHLAELNLPAVICHHRLLYLLEPSTVFFILNIPFVPKPSSKSSFSNWAFCSYHLILVMADTSSFLPLLWQTWVTWDDLGSICTSEEQETFPPIIELLCITICLHMDCGGRLPDIPINLWFQP